jgi:hypothetical protein
MAPDMRCRTGSISADSKPTLDTFAKNIGFIPNITATFARSPIAFNSWAALIGG